jgi:hypothetical protein
VAWRVFDFVFSALAAGPVRPKQPQAQPQQPQPPDASPLEIDAGSAYTLAARDGVALLNRLAGGAPGGVPPTKLLEEFSRPGRGRPLAVHW